MAEQNHVHGEKDLPIIQCPTKVYKGVLLFQNDLEQYEKLDILSDDIWICSYPRSGTTLTQEMTYLIRTLDYEKALSTQLDQRCPILDIKYESLPYYKGISMVTEMPPPRFIKTHIPYFLLPEQLRNGTGKIIYITRGPKDMCVSLYKLLRWYGQIKDDSERSFQQFCDSFIKGEQMFYGPWCPHVLEFWKHRHDANLLFLRYEDVSTDRCGAIRKIADFLGRDITDNDVTKIADNCSLERMRINKMVNQDYQREFRYVNDKMGGFINNGAIGGWKSQITDEMAARIDDMVARQLEPHGLTFPV